MRRRMNVSAQSVANINVAIQPLTPIASTRNVIQIVSSQSMSQSLTIAVTTHLINIPIDLGIINLTVTK